MCWQWGKVGKYTEGQSEIGDGEWMAFVETMLHILGKTGSRTLRLVIFLGFWLKKGKREKGKGKMKASNQAAEWPLSRVLGSWVQVSLQGYRLDRPDNDDSSGR